MFALAGCVAVIKFKTSVGWSAFALVTALLASVPMLQYAAGMIYFSGQAWTSTAYLLGFLFSIQLGTQWELNRPGQAMSALLAAIGFAAVVSVGMQLYQWTGIAGFDIWIVPLWQNRPFANLIQPNQMATLLLWALLALAWFIQKNRVGIPFALFVAGYLLFGLALTQSRMAIVAIALMAFAGWYWHKLWYSKRALRMGLSLLAFFVLSLLSIQPLSQALLLDPTFNAVNRIVSPDIRADAYAMFIDAIAQQPMWGYGWTTLAPAHLALAENHVSFGGVFQQSHNLFLELILWMGLPMGALTGIFLLVWFMRQVRRVAQKEDALLVLFVGVAWWHAMLEFPLHYAYILFPVGLATGVLGIRINETMIFKSSRATLALGCVAAVALLGVMTRDYLRMEADFLALRFERAYDMQQPAEVPETWVLSHLEAFIKLGRVVPHAGMTHDELDWMRHTSEAFPSHSNLYTYVSALAMNGFTEQAQAKMRAMPKLMTPEDYQQLGRIWKTQSKTNPALAATNWLSAPLQ